jgi:putative transcriptional regulator
MARMTLDQIKGRPSRMDHARVDATTEADIERYMREDGEDPSAPLGRFTEELPAAVVRARVGMSQAEFARALRIPVATLRNWEQGRVRPDPAAQSLLRIVARNPQAAFAALVGKS